MQTFLPLDDFQLSAEALDNARLGKQRVEVLQILKAIIDGEGWIHHPATHMWRGHTNALVQYGIDVCREWVKRGKADTCKDKITAYLRPNETHQPPPWFGLRDFHASHRSNLLRKDPIFYAKFCWTEPNNLPYCWPLLRNEVWYIRFKHAGAPKYEREYIL
jgi:hypothetical protein